MSSIRFPSSLSLSVSLCVSRSLLCPHPHQACATSDAWTVKGKSELSVCTKTEQRGQAAEGPSQADVLVVRRLRTEPRQIACVTLCCASSRRETLPIGEGAVPLICRRRPPIRVLRSVWRVVPNRSYTNVSAYSAPELVSSQSRDSFFLGASLCARTMLQLAYAVAHRNTKQ